MTIEDVYPVLPQMCFSHEGRAEPHPHITADGISGIVIRLNVELEGGYSLHDDDVVGCMVSLNV